MLTQAVVVTSAVALWLMLLAAVADELRQGQPIFCTIKAAMIATPIVIAAGFAITLELRRANPEPGNPPVPCDHGTDYDVRDGLCYKHVPLKYQRR